MFSNQTAFTPRPLSKVDSVAIRALAVLAANKDGRAKPGALRNLGIDPELIRLMVKRLYDASISEDRLKVLTVIKHMLAADTRVEDVISVLVPEAARMLGQDWVEDKATFSTVTIGCARLQASVHHLERTFAAVPVRNVVDQGNFLIAVPEGAQHTLGAVVLAAQIRQTGPHVRLALGVSDDQMSSLVTSESYDAVLISASLGQDMGDLQSLVRASRWVRSSAKVIVGGGILRDRPDLAEASGADLATNNWRDALKLGSQGLPCKYSDL